MVSNVASQHYTLTVQHKPPAVAAEASEMEDDNILLLVACAAL